MWFKSRKRAAVAQPVGRLEKPKYTKVKKSGAARILWSSLYCSFGKGDLKTASRDGSFYSRPSSKLVVVSKSPVKTEAHRFSSGCVDRLLPAIPQLPPKMCFPLNGTSPLPEVCIMPRASKRPAPGDLYPEFLDLMEPRNKLARLSCRYDQFNPIYDEVYSGSDGELLEEEEEENVYDEIAPDSLFGAAAFCRPRNRLVATRLRNRLSPRTRAKTVFQPRHPPSCLDLMQVSRFSCSFSDSAEDSESENIYALHGDEFLTEFCDDDTRPSSIYDEVASDYDDDDDEVDSVSDLDEGLELTTCFEAAQHPGGTAALGHCTFPNTVRPVVFPPSATANHCVKWMRRESFIV